MAEGFAHGLLVLSEYADVICKTTAPYLPAHPHCVVLNDPALAICWPVPAEPICRKTPAEALPRRKCPEWRLPGREFRPGVSCRPAPTPARCRPG
ncbi:dTDP-4-dehydrorhamnose 3,5-epimerase family protein [Achromobacter mucicolens]|uniref:dTDP-4-dehydrorhamnose 3,5-epimerase family protein n=1 Tax=Achromobacter mucicolens TaxID=1389922 RepID=UPI003D75B010